MGRLEHTSQKSPRRLERGTGISKSSTVKATKRWIPTCLNDRKCVRVRRHTTLVSLFHCFYWSIFHSYRVKCSSAWQWVAHTVLGAGKWQLLVTISANTLYFNTVFVGWQLCTTSHSFRRTNIRIHTHMGFRNCILVVTAGNINDNSTCGWWHTLINAQHNGHGHFKRHTFVFWHQTQV